MNQTRTVETCIGFRSQGISPAPRKASVAAGAVASLAPGTGLGVHPLRAMRLRQLCALQRLKAVR